MIAYERQVALTLYAYVTADGSCVSDWRARADEDVTAAGSDQLHVYRLL